MATDLSAFIRNSTWGKTLDTASLDQVVAGAREVQVARGHHLVRTGDPADHWIGLIDGVAVQQVISDAGKVAVLTTAGNGTWFGEGTLMKRGRWEYDATARRTCRVALVPYSVFKWLVDTSLAFNQFLAQLLNARLSHYMGLLANERLTQFDQRMARVLASLFDPDLYGNRPDFLRVSQTDIALMCGMSRQRANVALKRLREEGLVEVERAGVKVLDVAALKRY